MSDTAIVIPCFNEAKRLDVVRFTDFLNQNDNYALFLVDDGSTDETIEILEEIRRATPNQVIILKQSKNLGKGEAVRKGLLAAYDSTNYDQIGFLDADLSTPFSEFKAITDYLLLNNKKAVFGSRLRMADTIIVRSWIRHLIGRVIATFIRWTIKTPFYDTQCGAKVFTRSSAKLAADQPFISRWLFDVEIILRLKKQWGSEFQDHLHEYPLKEWSQVDGSKIRFIDMIKIPLELIKIRIKG